MSRMTKKDLQIAKDWVKFQLGTSINNGHVDFGEIRCLVGTVGEMAAEIEALWKERRRLREKINAQIG